ncbi:glycosyltransferase family 2 protein [Haladaptatus salinisoli]|uniref:glycosyltransferase family 2 protein n=1 Tax=Haladaptatus salinisoli TaxID=2884876 RepID=UPI001D0B06F7|nr:glycosyltransferase family 2 protein [Haladaptatus salinisoli]
MSFSLDLFLVGIAVTILVWGFNRYRTQFVKADLLTGIILAVGVLGFVFVPQIYDLVGLALDIRKRFVVVALLGNLALLTLVLYLHTNVRTTRKRVNKLTRNLSIDQLSDSPGERGDIQVVIPAYNEESTIRTIVESLPDSIAERKVTPIVVSDGSADDTAERARIDSSIVVEHPLNQGQGGALKTGFEIARRTGASIIVTMDGDGQHPVEELEALILPIINDEADFVMGSRYKGTDRSGNGTIRRAGIRVFTALINVLLKSDITDCTNGFRAIRGDSLTELTLTEERFSAPELIIEARKNGLRIMEIPITINERQDGETKKPRLGYAIGLVRTIISTWMR